MTISLAPFLYQVIQPDLSLSKIQRPVFFDETQDWAELLELSQRLGVSRIFLSRIREMPWALEVPELVRIRWDERFHYEKMVEVLIENDLRVIGGIFNDRKIDFALTGDVDLAYRYYENSFDRLIESLEIWVSEKHLSEAAQALGFLDYRSLDGCTYRRQKPGTSLSLPVQLKWDANLDAYNNIDEFEQIWERLQNDKFSQAPLELGYSAKSMHPEDVFVKILLNLSKEMLLDRPIWMNDLRAVHRHLGLNGNVDWDRIIWKLSQNQTLSLAWFALDYVKKEWNTPIHDDVLKLIGVQMSGFKKKLLARWMLPRNWLGKDGLEVPWMIRSGWLLRDHRFW